MNLATLEDTRRVWVDGVGETTVGDIRRSVGPEQPLTEDEKATVKMWSYIVTHPDAKPWNGDMGTERPPQRPTLGHVYIIEAVGAGRVKIGYASNVEQRLSTLRTASPLELRVVKVWQASAALEKRLHEALAEHRVRGEWFACSVTDEAVRLMDEWVA